MKKKQTQILQSGAPILRSVAPKVPKELFGSKKLTQLINEMTDTLEITKDGVALAGPQIGIPYRIFVVSPRAYPNGQVKQGEHLVYINPEILRKSKDKSKMEEGCLSVRNIFGVVERHNKATVRAQDEGGIKFTRGASGLLAQIFQHEIAHLDGELFTDRAVDLKEVISSTNDE